MTPDPDAPKVCEISDISYPHMAETEEDIQISDIEENTAALPCKHSPVIFL